VKSVSQFRIVAPEPANETTMRDLVGSRATKPLMSATVVSFLIEVRCCQSRRKGTYEPPNSTSDVTLSASTRGQASLGQVISESEVEFSLLGQYDAAVKFAKSLKLSRRLSDMPTEMLSGFFCQSLSSFESGSVC